MMNTTPLSSLMLFTGRALVLLTLLMVPARTLLAAEPPSTPAGKVAAVVGQVTAAGEDGAIRTIAKDDPIFAGDIVSTGPNSRVRIVFSDDGIIFLRPSSRFVIKSYNHSGSPEKDESSFSLVRGGFRSVTGAIGQSNPKNYKVDTPVATIGIRGTDHEGRLCINDCTDLVDVGVSPPPDGLYTGTNTGETVIGNQNFGAGEYGFTNMDRQTFQLPQPPQILVKDPLFPTALTDPGSETPGQEGGTGGEGQGDNASGIPEGGSSATPAGSEEGFEIPAQPPVTHTINCR